MSYARFGCDGSDVYVFTSSLGLECCGCILQTCEWVDDPASFIGGWMKPTGEIVPHIFLSNDGMIEHLDLHRQAGHTVPEYVFERLRDPKDAAENLKYWPKP